MLQNDTAMSYTLGQAAKVTGVSKMTISRAIKNGTISALKNNNGGYEIDPSELHRVFPPVSSLPVTETDNVTKRYPEDTGMLHRVKELEVRLEVAGERLHEKDVLISEIRQERDDWKKQAQTLLLQAPPRSGDIKPAEANSESSGGVPSPTTKNALHGLNFASGGVLFLLVLGIGFLGWIFWPEIHARMEGGAVTTSTTPRNAVSPAPETPSQ